MNPLSRPGHTVQYGSQRTREGLHCLTLECSCGRIFGSRLVKEDNGDQRAFLWLEAGDRVGAHLAERTGKAKESDETMAECTAKCAPAQTTLRAVPTVQESADPS